MKDKNLIKSTRLLEVFKEIEECDTLIDLASDHGQLGYNVKKQGKAKNVIVTDIRDSCINNMKNKYGDYLDIRKGNGLEIVKPSDKLDTLVIAGIGARNIIEILSKYNYTFSKYILAPHQDVELLREYLIDNYNVEKDRMIKDQNKYYNIIVARKGSKKYSEEYINFGYNSYNDPVFREYIDKEKIKIKNKIVGASIEYKDKLLCNIDKIDNFIKGEMDNEN